MKIKNIVLLLCGIWVLNSCTEADITAEPAGRELVETFYQTDDQIILALNGAYDPLQHVIWGGGHFMWGSITSDDAVGGGSDGADQKGYQVCDRFIANPVEDKEPNLEEYYTLWWRMNTRCNAIIAYADPTSKLGSKGVANAYFLKGMAYFQLTRMFGGMPIIDKVPGINDKFNERVSIEDSYGAAVGYLTEAINMTTGGLGLDVRSGQKDPGSGYATLGSAQALLGKIYMYQGKYAEAINALSNLVNSGQYDLEPEFEQVFHPGNPHGLGSIFEINMTDKGAQDWSGPGNNGNALATLVSPRAFTNNIRMFPDSVHLSGWGMNQPTPKLVAAFDAMGDVVRKNATVISKDTLQYFCDNAQPDSIKTAWQNVVTGYFDNKHSLRVGYYTSATQVNQNIILLRYADVLLLLAEAYYQTGDEASARAYLNQVRSRVELDDVTASGNDLLIAIKKERQLELALEGDRYFDLVRWGDAAAELTGEEYDAGGNNYSNGWPGTKTKGLFPIPFNEISAFGDAGFAQNEGY